MEKCENCERRIGKLETPCVWKEQTVCTECYERLSRTAAQRESEDQDILAAAIRGEVGQALPSASHPAINRAQTGKKKVERGPWKILWLCIGCGVILLGVGGYVAVKLASRSPSAVAAGSVATPPQPAAQPQVARPTPQSALAAAPTAARYVSPQPPVAQPVVPSPTPIIQASPPVVAPPKPGKVIGAAWLTNNKGSSNVMRGLRVAVLKPSISCVTVAQNVALYVPKWKELAQDYRKMATDIRKSAKELGHDLDSGAVFQADGEKRAKEEEATATQYENTARQLQQWLQSARGEMDAADAYKFLKSASTHGLAELPLSGIVVAEAKTNVDGKYVIENVPPGAYYLYGLFGSSTAWIDWLVPVTVGPGQELSVDLDNDNAATIRDPR